MLIFRMEMCLLSTVIRFQKLEMTETEGGPAGSPFSLPEGFQNDIE